MAKLAVLSTQIDPDVKRAVSHYCKRRGLKLRFVVENALVEQLEDEIDLQTYFERRNEKTFSLEEMLSKRRRISPK